ncbi:helix-turn-helix domain-containing protein [Litoreibacter janthinus]|uniref:Helix-turn-helix domain-containing protein n=1 Tax=Litoreibacter janthinus TaxID=670154 RepID=A0A1I6GS56_9RHOB|nr:helix-turn-helix domain-containing protein [Litoreibacter janthinus]SFR45018.1 Helix-turn-helix domain-containing protein [Litoreibacter janthinus]
MSKRANPMAVKSALTYDVSEAAKALGKSPATIRNWIKDGLPVMARQKPCLISGEAIRNYLRAKYRKAKSQLSHDELYCLSCRAGRKPVRLTVEVIPNNTKTTRLRGRCECCGAVSTRIISNSKAHAFAQTFDFKEGENRDA